MCSRTTCSVCQKATWTGCGMHIESALRGVPESQRCPEYLTGKHKSSMMQPLLIVLVLVAVYYFVRGRSTRELTRD
ncbi:hypothetical protein Ae201684P_006251 [Aphanomyces euteiches]|uniref:Uncharacterized protein n=1 Tax=Aphanomyces euteiches TaxID=100861 RepID=A0A6G0XBC1_9STRA|nr:hypothetical protein Ae201684_006576 [Aphanomyces euteiches]KAH9090847.1 hypothetical protein Ae201684P_006251 [Aphanomyces euteiches]